MANYFHDEQVTWQKMHEQWKSQQNKMRLKLRVEDMFNWEVPKQVSIKYDENGNFGLISVNNNISLRRLKKWRQKNNVNTTDEGKDNSTEKKSNLRYIGGVDISFTKPGAFEYDKACAGLMIFEYPSMKLIHEETEIVTLKHPYIAGFLAFREVSYLIKLVNKLKKARPDIVPDIILVDGNGILHYRRVGLATHLSMRVNIPCIGIAKKLLAIDNLNVDYLVPHLNKKLNKIGAFSKIKGWNEEQVGYALRTHQNDDIVYVSPGNMVSMETSLKIVMLCLDPERRYKLPLPTEKADFVTRKQIKRYQQQHGNPYQYNNNNSNYSNYYYNNNNNNYGTNEKRGNRGNNNKNMNNRYNDNDDEKYQQRQHVNTNNNYYNNNNKGNTTNNRQRKMNNNNGSNNTKDRYYNNNNNNKGNTGNNNKNTNNRYNNNNDHHKYQQNNQQKQGVNAYNNNYNNKGNIRNNGQRKMNNNSNSNNAKGRYNNNNNNNNRYNNDDEKYPQNNTYRDNKNTNNRFNNNARKYKSKRMDNEDEKNNPNSRGSAGRQQPPKNNKNIGNENMSKSAKRRNRKKKQWQKV